MYCTSQALKGMLNSNTKLVATVHVSNMLASITDVADLTKAAHAVCIGCIQGN